MNVTRYATPLAALLTGAAGMTVGLCAFLPAEQLRTVEIGIAAESQVPAEWTERVIRDGWAATPEADRDRACQATPAQLRAAAPRTSYDPARYDVETAIVTLNELCGTR